MLLRRASGKEFRDNETFGDPMTDAPPDDPPKRRPGRPAARPDGRAMTAAERQERRRNRLVDREPVQSALVVLALARRELNDLLKARGGPSADPGLHAMHLALLRAEQELCLSLGQAPAWAHRKATAIRWRRADEAAAAEAGG
ncbi:hypothetical protein ACP4J4_12000 [Aureimonas ureilytica]|uniref:hypothetical protein n=1 Tax=Aureimonas ureilytica TaxID=401562 RepID=UPI003CF0A687